MASLGLASLGLASLGLCLATLLALHRAIHEPAKRAHNRKGHRHHEQDAVVDAAREIGLRAIAIESRLATGAGRRNRGGARCSQKERRPDYESSCALHI